ncbi:sulfite exporter TauE/SafE family protein [Desertihabitans aurantiacus]|uniref:sulfite exporter TauE/SafE family protein n=1 Tax=Desertihabitans aurantiacus TaxID=2282477 RepID=UPI000DF7B0F7|nr:TSUP family transporter [Desertihabitans aurantiacus]
MPPDIALHVVLLLVGVAFLAGWVDAVVGGGGLIQLPALLLALPSDTSVPEISGTNKVSSVAGTAVATLTYLRKVRPDWAVVVPLVVAAFAGSALGAQLVRLLPRDAFTPIVLVALVAVGVYTVRRPQLGLEHDVRHSGFASVWRSAAIGGGVGVYDGFLGPGTGSFFVILVVAVLGYGFLQATAKAKLANLTTNLAAIGVLAWHGQVLWLLGVLMAAANLTGAFIGARMALRHGSGFVRRVFLVVVGAMILRLGWDTVQIALRVLA